MPVSSDLRKFVRNVIGERSVWHDDSKPISQDPVSTGTPSRRHYFIVEITQKTSAFLTSTKIIARVSRTTAKCCTRDRLSFCRSSRTKDRQHREPEMHEIIACALCRQTVS